MKDWKRRLQYVIPSHIHDPFGLAMRMIRSREPAARFALKMATFGVLCTPLDLILQRYEKKLYKQNEAVTLPLIFVCGASRTGTTLVSQVLINNLPVFYFNNLTALFPRSPIVANKLFGRFLKPRQIEYTSYYGKTLSLSGPNEAFYLWNRWMKEDENHVKCIVDNSKINDMTRFFATVQSVVRKPVLNKYNNLNVCADSIAKIFENAYFICMSRDPIYLAQSLLKARLDIQGDMNVSYGVDAPGQLKNEKGNYIQDTCRQILFHEEKIREQQKIVGKDRYWLVSYESFCHEPHLLVKRVYEDILKESVDIEKVKRKVGKFKVSSSNKVDEKTVEQIKETYRHLKSDKSTSSRSI